MPGEIVTLDPDRPDPALSRSREVIAAGGIIVYPTDTFYGLGADPENPDAVKRLFEIKGRGFHRPVLLLLADRADVRRWAAEVGPAAERLMNEYWPGPLTLVFKAGENVLPLLTAGTGTVGLRVPGNAATRRLIAFVGSALTGTSANISGRGSLRTAQEAALAIGSGVDLIVDGGPTPGGSPSTVVDVSSGRATLIREGAIPLAGISRSV